MVDSNDEVFRLSRAKFERLFSHPPRDTVLKFAEQRVRAAEVAVELENGRPARVLRVIFHYMQFDRHGRLDYERTMKDSLTVIEAGMPDFNVEPRVRNVIAARQRFAACRRDHSVWWRPTARLQRDIMQAALDNRRYRRV